MPPIAGRLTDKWPATWLASVFVVVLTGLVYANSFPGIFVFDDELIVVNNPLLQHFDPVRIFLSDYWGYGENSGLYRPLTILSLAIDRQLFGGAVWGYHLVNVLMHAGVALLLLRLLLAWGSSLPVAVLAASLFVVHPIHTEVVDVVVGRSELLVALFLLAGLWFAATETRWWKFLAGGCYLLALLSKEHGIIFLALLPLAEAFSAGTCGVWRRRWRYYATLGSITGLWLLWRIWGIVHTAPHDLPFNSLSGLDLPTRIMSALALQGFYLGKLLWPSVLQMNYQGHNFSAFIIPPLSATGAFIVAALAVLAAVAYRGWQRRSLLALSIIFYAVSFSPVANIFFLPNVTFAERLAYFPSLWFCTGIAVLLVGIAKSRRLILIFGLVGFLYVGALSVRLFVRNTDFSDPIRLWQTEVKNDPLNPGGWQLLAETYARDEGQDRSAEAEQAYRRLFQLPRGEAADSLMSWATFLIRRGRYDEALVAARKAVQIRLDAHEPAAGEMWVLASLLVELRQYEEALVWLDRRREYYGNAANDWDIRGEALQGLGRLEEAAAEYAQVKTWPAGIDGPFRYASVLFQLGRLAEARDLLQQIVAREGGSEAWNLLGVVAAQQGDWRAATEAFSRAVQLAPDNRPYQENLQRARQRAERN